MDNLKVLNKPLLPITMFIRNFKYSPFDGVYRKDLEKIFANGLCYHFSRSLQDLYPDGNIYYDTTRGHFVFKLYGKYYDITGEVKYDTESSKSLVKWNDFRKYDELEYKRIVEQVIYKMGAV